jgi:hypothetical protein
MTSPSPPLLRVACVWGTTVLSVRTLRRGESFLVGDGAADVLPQPDGLEIAKAPMRAAPGGWELDAKGAIAGLLTLRGRPEDPVFIGKSGNPVQVMPGDYGLLQYGLLSLFFQYTGAPPAVLRQSRGDVLTLLATASSLLFHTGLLGLMRSLMTPPPIMKPFELTPPEDFAARFGLRKAIFEVPPPATGPQDNAGPGDTKSDEKTTTAAPKAHGNEGKLGTNDPHARPDVRGEPSRATNLGGISEVLNSEAGEEIKRTLNSINTVSNALNGLNGANLVLGGGPGGGLHGNGSGGGGMAVGVPFGSGNLATGWGGAGNGGRAGRGGTGNGPGVAGGAPTGGAAERAVAVNAGSPAAAGGLSQDQVRRVVLAHTGALRACYETEAQKNPGLKGGVTVAWQIDASGSVSSASIASSTLSNPRVEGCIVRQVRSWRFPASESTTTVASYPFRFGVGN